MLGIIVEGTYDEQIIRALVAKIIAEEPIILAVGGKTKLANKLKGWLESFRYERVDKVLVIRDQDNECIKIIREKLQQGLAGRNYPFTLKFCIIQVTIETWLLADEQALSQATGRAVSPVQGNLEALPNPKARLMDILSACKMNYTSEQARRIAALADLEKIIYRCPGFQRFREAVLDC